MKHPRRPRRLEGQLDLDDYAPIGDGRSVAVSGADGGIDWWGGTAIDDAPVFDRLLGGAGFFAITPVTPFSITRRYRPDSNILETLFLCDGGRARLTESLNSGIAGRLPWSELARRIEVTHGRMRFAVRLRIARPLETPRWETDHGVRRVAVLSDGLTLSLIQGGTSPDWQGTNGALDAEFELVAGQRALLGLLVTRDRPVLQVHPAAIDARLDESDYQWRAWSNKLTYAGQYSTRVRRSALALKLLLFSPSGAIAAAATTSLPELPAVGKNYDYRFAWVRDVAYSIKAFLLAGGDEEAIAAFTWLLGTIRRHGPEVYVFYTLDGERPGDARDCELPGYRGHGPVRVGNGAAGQQQHGIYGDVLDAAWTFVSKGHRLDATSQSTLCAIVEQAVQHWESEDSSIWELPEVRHYTVSKMACWGALDKAIQLADDGHLPARRCDAWRQERDRIATWIETHAWSEARQCYLMSPEGSALDASVMAGLMFGYPQKQRLASTVAAIERELGCGLWLYRYSGMQQEESPFLACAFWYVEALVKLGRTADAVDRLEAIFEALPHDAATLHEMIDPETLAAIGNFPQGLSHLSLILAAAMVSHANGIPP